MVCESRAALEGVLAFGAGVQVPWLHVLSYMRLVVFIDRSDLHVEVADEAPHRAVFEVDFGALVSRAHVVLRSLVVEEKPPIRELFLTDITSIVILFLTRF